MSKKMKYIITILVVVLVLTCVAVPVFAKYIKEDESEIGINAMDFYFTSDLLAEPTTHETFPEYKLGKGNNTISFKLNNYEDETRFTTVDIKYELTVYNSSNFPVYDKAGTITAGTSKKSVSFEIPSLGSGTYIVEVVSTLPYSKTLKGKFIIPEVNDDISYTVSDGVGSTVVMLTVSVEDYSGNINIKWPNGVTPDISDPLLAGAIDCENYTVVFNSYSEYTFVFFKNNSSQVYTNTDFEITK